MTQAMVRGAVITATLLLTGCGQYLGSYTIEAAKVVTEVPKSHMSPAQQGQYLEIDLASETSLTAIGNKVDAVYVHADFCPIRNPDGLIVFGPYGDRGEDLSEPSDASVLGRGRDGRFRYRVYVLLANRAEPATKPGQLQLPTYDLRRTSQDICMRLFAPGYNLIKSYSSTIRVPAERISAALKGAPNPGSP
jgi:hypothetical protein